MSNKHQHRNPMRPNGPERPNSTGDQRFSDEDIAAERSRLSGMRARRRLKDVPEVKRRELVERSLDLGLEAARSINDRNISLFSRGLDPMFAGINTFLKSPYVENIREVGRFDVAVVGAPFDMGTTYRSGTRFGPQAVRRISALYDSYSPDLGMDLLEEITIGDVGDIFVIPANIEKTFDQIDLGISHPRRGSVSGHHRRRPQHRIPRHEGARQACRRSAGHHPFRPPHRHSRHDDGRTHAHHALVARDGPAQRAGIESGADRHRRLDRQPFRRPSG